MQLEFLIATIDMHAQIRLLAYSVAWLVLAGAQVATAQTFTISFTVHEDGTGTFDNGVTVGPIASDQRQDVGPGGLSNALTFSLLGPPRLVAGDLFLTDPTTMQLSDIIRFNPNETGADGKTGVLVFYSLAGGGALADTGFPSANYTNTFSLTENPLGETLYTPLAGQPGFVAGTSGVVTYHIFSEELPTSNGVPEQGRTAVLMALSMMTLIGVAWARPVAQRAVPPAIS